jgi:hypothetical protein
MENTLEGDYEKDTKFDNLEEVKKLNGVPTGLNFGLALDAAKNGEAIRLPSWKEDVFISLQVPDEHSKMTHPYLYVTSRFGRVPWHPTQVEILSNEWQLKT